MLHYNRFWSEQTMRLRLPACSLVKNRRIDSVVVINDFNGMGMSTFNKASFDMIRSVTKQGSDYCPETLKVSYIINAPMAFTAIYAIVKNFLEEDTRKKMVILGSDYEATLLKNIDSSQLPVFLGGSCTCKEMGGDCMRSDKGPWQDF